MERRGEKNERQNWSLDLGALAPTSAYSKPDTLKAPSISSTSISVPPLCKTNWESSPGRSM